ncbi:Os02g0299800 [Oryza sativa Japonica Group]|uniref:Os02g0299800 protein n=3 Tax=Oryza TaxID=4527 RepID=A0A0P0VHX8_ORYSJ|nr:Os02g0299800 [Oryza sativa Japonica Group]
MSLSRYCAYLVSSAPDLLPDHQYTTQTIAEAVLLDLRRCLHGCTSNEAAVLKLQDTAKLAIRTPSTSAPDSIHVLGVRLAEDLMKIGEAKRWEVLADFWAELMLFVTPADNAMAHVEHLTMGGELITHLWALLTHAGIVQRPSHATQSQSV